jgi:hypothetical protein
MLLRVGKENNNREMAALGESVTLLCPRMARQLKFTKFSSFWEEKSLIN